MLIRILLSNGVLFCVCSPMKRSLVNNNGQRQGGREALDGQALPRIPELPAAEHS